MCRLFLFTTYPNSQHKLHRGEAIESNQSDGDGHGDGDGDGDDDGVISVLDNEEPPRKRQRINQPTLAEIEFEQTKLKEALERLEHQAIVAKVLMCCTQFITFVTYLCVCW